MRRAAGIAGAMAVAVLLSGCGSTPTASHESPTASLSPNGLMVLLLRTDQKPATAAIELVDTTGHLRARADFSPPAAPHVSGCVPVTPPVARIAAGAVFYADSKGVIHRLDADGTSKAVATFPITSDQFLSFAVSPDGQQLIAILFSTPPVKNPIPPFGTDPYIATGTWTLDLEMAPAGGATTTVLHSDYGHTYPATGPTIIAGWDDAGPIATLNTYMCVQNSVPSVEYIGSPLIHLGTDGTHLDTIGGSACHPWDELHDGTVLCGGGDWASFAVRSRLGADLWSGAVAGFISEPRLSPDGNGVVVNGDQVEILMRGEHSPASFGRAGGARLYTLLGWFGNDYVVALRDDQRLGLVPVTHPSNFVATGLTLPPACNGCFPNPVALVGTIGI